MNRRDVPFDEAGFEKNRLDTVENVSLLVIFLDFLGTGWFWGKIYRPNLIFDKTLFSKSFLQFETPRSLVLAPNPLPQSPQKFNSINVPYIDAVTFFAVSPVSWLPEDKTTRNFRNFLS